VLCCTCGTSPTAAAPQQQPGYSSIRRALTQAPAPAAKEKPQFDSVFAAMLGLPEGKVIRDTYLNTFGTMSDPTTRAKFQSLLNLATVSAWPGTYQHQLLKKSCK
jgi:hypothetical protein